MCAAALIVAVAGGVSPVSAQENFSAKPAPQLFSSDCTGSGCHGRPQGLAKGMSQMGLTSFLRAHYTNSRESAAALASYLVGLANVPTAADPRARRQAQPPAARPAPRTAARTTEEPKPPAAAQGRAGAETAPTPVPSPRAAPAGRKPAAVAAAPPASEPQAPPPEPPAPKQWDIFD
jgi:hypothetical protein